MNIFTHRPRNSANRQLIDHIAQLHDHDYGFRHEWQHLHPIARTACLQTLIGIDSDRATLSREGLTMSTRHRGAASVMAQRLNWVDERDFPVPPQPSFWIKLGDNRRFLWSLHEKAALQLNSMIAPLGDTTAAIQLFGGVKSASSIACRIEAYEKGLEGLDLWDLVRFRFVTADLSDLSFLASELLRTFAGKIVRCRNYYVNPRRGQVDPYRAIHYEIDLGEGSPGQFVELQVLTWRRHVLGMIDHAYIHRHSLRLANRNHSNWLKELSHTANVLDSLIGSPHPMPPQ